MRFVEVKTPEQVDLPALHRIRDQVVSNRTRSSCQSALERDPGSARKRDPSVVGRTTD